MPARVYKLTSSLSGEAWDDARGAAGFITGICRTLLPVLEGASQDAVRGMLKTEAAALALAKLTTLDEENGKAISDAYWEANEAFKRLRPLMDRDWVLQSYECPECRGSSTPCAYCGGSGYTGPRRAPAMHAVQACAQAASFIQVATRNSPGDLAWQQREQNDRLAIIATEAKQAGATKSQLLRQEWIWRFFACGGRMPLTEQVLLAFQAAWEIGHYDFARSIARQGFGELTSEQAAMLDK